MAMLMTEIRPTFCSYVFRVDALPTAPEVCTSRLAMSFALLSPHMPLGGGGGGGGGVVKRSIQNLKTWGNMQLD